MRLAIKRHEQRVDWKLAIRARGCRDPSPSPSDTSRPWAASSRNPISGTNRSARPRSRTHNVAAGASASAVRSASGTKQNASRCQERNPRPRALLGPAQRQTFDGMRAKVGAKWRQMAPRTVDGEASENHAATAAPASRATRSADAVGRQDEAPWRGRVPSAGRWQGSDAGCRRGRRDFGGGKICLERRAAALRQRAVVICRVEPAIGDQHLMRMYAPAAAAIASARAKVAESTKRPSRKAYSERGNALSRAARCACCLPDRKNSATADTGMPPSILP